MMFKYKVLLLLAHRLNSADFCVTIQGDNYTVQIAHALGMEAVNSFDLVITDKSPADLKQVLQVSRCRVDGIVLRKNPTFLFQKDYEELFANVKYPHEPFSISRLQGIIKTELVKSLAIHNKVPNGYLILSKYTRLGFFKRSWSDLGLLLVPFTLILVYYTVRNICGNLGYPIAFLTWFVDYQPDSAKDIYSDLRLVTLLYSLCNLMFYYAFILKVFENVDPAVLQTNAWRRLLHKCCELSSPLILFISGLVILKELFLFKKGQAIAQEFGFINIGHIFDERLPFLRDQYLIFYFVILDVLLWVMMLNVISAMKVANPAFPETTSRRRQLLTSAKRSAGVSWLLGIVVLLITWAILDPLLQDPQSRVVVQLILLQAFYLYVNLSIVYAEFKHE